MAGRKPMTIKEFGELMKRCETEHAVNYVRPTIHAGARLITAIDLFMHSSETVSFTVTNNPDENFQLTKAVHDYLDNRQAERMKS